MKKIIFLSLIISGLAFSQNINFNTDKKDHINDMSGYFPKIGISILKYEDNYYVLKDENIKGEEIQIFHEDVLKKAKAEYLYYTDNKDGITFYSWDTKKKQLVRIKVDSKTKNKTIEYFGKEKLNLVK